MAIAQTPTGASQKRNGNQLGSIVTLAFWQVRQVWRLLLFTTLGMIAAIVLACAVPLFSRVTMSAGIRHGLTNPIESSYITVRSTAHAIVPDQLTSASADLNTYFHQNLGKYITEKPQFSIYTPGYAMLSGDGAQKGPLAAQAQDDQMQLISMDMQNLGPHVTIIQGRLPSDTAQETEIALQPEVASYLKATVGSQIVLQTLYNNDIGNLSTLKLPLRIVGLFKAKNPTEALWHQNTFSSDALAKGSFMRALVPTTLLVQALSQIQPNPFISRPYLVWYYHLNTSRIDATNMDDLVAGLNNVPIDVPTYTNNPPTMEQAQVITPLGAVQEYQNRISVAQTPVTILAILIIGLLLFFQTLMAEILIDRQSSTIALLRSRGSSSQQILWAFVLQSLLVAIIALLVAPFLAILVVRFLVQRTLSVADQGALNLIDGNPLPVAFDVRWFALGVAIISVITMIFSIYRMTNFDVLALRREAARTTRRAFWQRFYLDIILIVIASAGYGFSYYLEQTGVLDAQLTILLKAPLTLICAILLLIGCSLLFVRLFPLLLQLGGKLTARGRNVGAMLALAQMARSPYQSIRMMLLLMFATTFVIFTLIFNASQSQHILDTASYQAGADFSGTITSSSLGALSLKQQTTAYNKVAGVKTTSVGYSNYVHTTTNSSNDVDIKLFAIDPNTFVNATIWSPQTSLPTLRTLMHQLTSNQANLQKLIPVLPPEPTSTTQPATTSGTITTPDTTTQNTATTPLLPAIVDSATWDTFKLTPGKHFTLLGPEGTATFVALGQIPHIPSINDNAPKEILERGMLVDFQSFAAIYAKTNSDVKNRIIGTLNTNHVWLSSKDDPQSLASVRMALTNGRLQLIDLNDRNAIITQGHNDPLYLDIVGVLTLGALAPIFLALIGNLIASWLNVRGRLTSFAMLRALGTTPRQLASILTWEQCLVYACALGLGTLFGFALSALTLPSLVFTSVTQTGVSNDVAGTDTSTNVYALQNVPPIHLVIPSSLLLVLAGLIVICIIVLGILVRTVSRPTIGQTLRLNED